MFGTGAKGLFAPPAVRSYLNGLGIQVDVLDSVRSAPTPPTRIARAVVAVRLPGLLGLTHGCTSEMQRNAAATFNLLQEEGRRVAAALYPISHLSARTGVVA